MSDPDSDVASTRAAAVAALAEELGVDPAILGSQPIVSGPEDLLPDVAAAFDAVAAVITVDELRPALAALGVRDPDRYVIAWR